MTFELYGRRLDRERLERLGGWGGAHIGVERRVLDEGAARGVRVLELKAGPDCVLSVAVDRGFDPVQLVTAGTPIGWTAPGHLRHPALTAADAEDGFGRFRGYSGLLVTCGLDHYGPPRRREASAFGYEGRPHSFHPMHGRIGLEPAEVRSAEIDWAQHAVVARARVRQSSLFAEHLDLERTIHAPLGGRSVTIEDRVTNLGFRPAPHRMLYHWNFGWPLLDEGAELIVPSRGVVWRAEGSGDDWARQPAPIDGRAEEVWEFALDGAEGVVTVLNASARLGARVRFDRATLPHLAVWRASEPGVYALGVEPMTHPIGFDGDDLLAPRETRSYRVSIEAAQGAAFDAFAQSR